MSVRRIAKWLRFEILLQLFCSVAIQGLIEEGKILLEFKSNVFDRLSSLDSWGSVMYDEDPCGGERSWNTWAGVTCSSPASSGKSSVIHALNLRSLSLASPDVSVLANLTNLRDLDLRENSFSGNPPNLSKLKELRWLKLGNNQFEGTLVDLFGTWIRPGLEEIELQNNLFTGEVRTIPNELIHRLDLHGNNFSGELPEMTALTFGPLSYFDVSGNQFEGPLPSNLINLFLGYCNMSGNRFTGETQVDGTRGWSGRGALDLSRNKLSGNIPAAIFSSITYLDLSDNELEGFSGLSEGQNVSTELKYLYLQNNRLTGDFFNFLRFNFSSLQELRLHGNGRGSKVSGADQGDVLLGGSFSWFDNTDSELKSLYLSARCYPQFESSDFLNHTDLFPVSAANRTINLPRLRVLDLSGCDLEGSIPSDIFNPQTLPSLKTLDLSGNSLVGRIPSSLRRMPWLRELRLGTNLLNGHVDKWIDSNWTNLEVLDISENCLWFDTLQAIEVMLKFPSLKELRLGRNSAIGGIGLPKELNGSLELLEVLDLSHLYLLGNISFPFSSPTVFRSLRYLDLSGNQLSGTVPDRIGDLPRLTHLNLSHNILSGEIPILPPVLFNREFFMGNDELCGPPLQHCQVSPESLVMWNILLIVAVSVVFSSGSCLILGWIWRKRTDAKKHKQDAELIAALLDRDTTTLMPLRELRKATDDFSEENRIGEGGFGTVYRGVLEDGTVVAIKRSKRDGSTSEDKYQFLNEVKILSQVHHRNLVRLLGCCLANKNALLVLEFVPNGTLQEHLHSEAGHSPLSWDQRLIIAIQTASALDYLHSSANPPIYHLDVKSANILLDIHQNAKVADFGISKLAPALDATHITALHGLQGTFGYMDPELIVKSVLTDKSDVYAFGVVLLELITAKAVMDRSRGEDISLVKWAETMMRRGKLEEIIDPVILDTYRTSDGRESIDAMARLAMDCLLFRSEDRPTMKDCIRDLLCIQQGSELRSSKRTAVSRNEEVTIELSAMKGFTI